jgi:hypothetical protein
MAAPLGKEYRVNLAERDLVQEKLIYLTLDDLDKEYRSFCIMKVIDPGLARVHSAIHKAFQITFPKPKPKPKSDESTRLDVNPQVMRKAVYVNAPGLQQEKPKSEFRQTWEGQQLAKIMEEAESRIKAMNPYFKEKASEEATLRKQQDERSSRLLEAECVLEEANGIITRSDNIDGVAALLTYLDYHPIIIRSDIHSNLWLCTANGTTITWDDKKEIVFHQLKYLLADNRELLIKCVNIRKIDFNQYINDFSQLHRYFLQTSLSEEEILGNLGFKFDITDRSWFNQQYSARINLDACKNKGDQLTHLIMKHPELLQSIPIQQAPAPISQAEQLAKQLDFNRTEFKKINIITTQKLLYCLKFEKESGKGSHQTWTSTAGTITICKSAQQTYTGNAINEQFLNLLVHDPKILIGHEDEFIKILEKDGLVLK